MGKKIAEMTETGVVTVKSSDSGRAASEVGASDGTTQHFEILVVGGGLAGLSMSAALASAGIAVAVVDRDDPENMISVPYDGRSSALARGSQQMLAAIGVWPHMAAAAQPILDIRVSDGKIGRATSRLFLHYDHQDVSGEPLGYIVENRATRLAFQAHLPTLPTLTRFAPNELSELQRGADGMPGANRVRAVLKDGQVLTAELVIAADGRNSTLRREAGIRSTNWDYPQCGIVGTVHHERPHEGVAHEHFLPAGPFALLPMTDGEKGEYRSSLVWTESRALTPHMLALDEAAFCAEMQRRFGDSLGRLRMPGKRWSYPLSLMHAERYSDHRLALIGDAAHAIHPISGQGFNLGLKDVAALSECIVDARRLGLDIGSPQVLERYERWRRFDNMALIATTDGLNRLFSNDLPPVRLARDLGLAAVNRMPGLKRFFMSHAMGLVGDLPRLIQGRPL
ncbi:UbiH/UbiF/VisC/COQ6 family ubiquinone biosynthesis hydroxylase [Pelagibius sp. Alg239-R121]|uniref:UbiH/UbiF/VisC/COQ6 family ubiquinone biosynthesis hydroxylase n=1 Tax=Pelagibius sp. Alg239-R121 TaxID=2993448 RepID=UPI0024A724BA|nr:UbiH/UbiF/VisC/COQ6 family ubiquinone biosynthesis hydroxylase [Pelagibius sp. Alg239-R121]